MPSFDARLRLPGQTKKIPVSVVVDISGERLKLTSGVKVLGDWPLDQVSVVSLPDGFHLNLEGEEIVLSVSDPNTFFGYLQNGRNDQAHVVAVNGVGATDSAISKRLKVTDSEEQYTDLRAAVDKVAAALLEEEVPPNQVFATWLRLLKELNRRHGQGQLPTPLFYRLNTELLDMLPSPDHETV
jgi:hypothetical protein